MLGFLDKMVQHPLELTPDDARAVRAAGVPDEGLRTAIHVCAAFTTITRIADTFQFAMPPAEAFHAMGKSLLKRGYVM